MKSTLLLATALAFPCLASAQTESNPGAYVRLGAGVSMVEDIDGYVDDLFNPELKFDLTLDPGVRVDVAPGYNFNQYLGFEFNTGVIWNSLDAFEFEDGFVGPVEGDLVQVPLLANVTLRYPSSPNPAPFGGRGGGGAYARLSSDGGGSSDDFFAAYQFFAGAPFELQDELNVGFVYKYLTVLSEEDASNGPERAGMGDIVT